MDAVELAFPFTGSWLVQNSPARRVPSHGTHAFGTSHAIDFVAVDERGRSAPRSARGLFRPEPSSAFVGFGADILAPVSGVVAAVHDGELDHDARRSPLTLIPYMLGQARRARAGTAALAGNHVVIALKPRGPFVVLAHRREGSIRVHPGDDVAEGAIVGECGNSGNSTEPHLHLQVSDSYRDGSARGIPIVFRRTDGTTGVPDDGEIVVA